MHQPRVAPAAAPRLATRLAALLALSSLTVAGCAVGVARPGSTTRAGAPPVTEASPTSVEPRPAQAPRQVSRAAPPRPFSSTRKGVACTGPGTAAARRRAQVVQDRVGAALPASGRSTAVGVEDLATGVRCTARGARRYDSASVVKVLVLAALLQRARTDGRALTAGEQAWARAAITRSDNAATTALWNRIGRGPGLRPFLAAAGMRRTVPGAGSTWGLTQITADDELKLLHSVVTHGALTTGERSYVQRLMLDVVPSQRWGVPVGARAGVPVGNKNGWLPRATKGWRVHSIGFVRDGGGGYTVSLLSEGNSTFGAGISRLNRLSRAVHAAATAPPARVRTAAPEAVPTPPPPA